MLIGGGLWLNKSESGLKHMFVGSVVSEANGVGYDEDDEKR